MSEGYILWYRKAEDNPILQDDSFDRMHAWIWLVEHAGYKKVRIPFNGGYKTLRRGQFWTSIRKLAATWGWSKDKVANFLKSLEINGMIRLSSDTNGTLVTIEKYNTYQPTQDTTKDANKDTNKDTNKDANSPQINKRNKGTVADPRNRGPLPLEEVDPRYLDLPRVEPDKW